MRSRYPKFKLSDPLVNIKFEISVRRVWGISRFEKLASGSGLKIRWMCRNGTAMQDMCGKPTSLVLVNGPDAMDWSFYR